MIAVASTGWSGLRPMGVGVIVGRAWSGPGRTWSGRCGRRCPRSDARRALIAAASLPDGAPAMCRARGIPRRREGSSVPTDDAASRAHTTNRCAGGEAHLVRSADIVRHVMAGDQHPQQKPDDVPSGGRVGPRSATSSPAWCVWGFIGWLVDQWLDLRRHRHRDRRRARHGRGDLPDHAEARRDYQDGTRCSRRGDTVTGQLVARRGTSLPQRGDFYLPASCPGPSLVHQVHAHGLARRRRC